MFPGCHWFVLSLSICLTGGSVSMHNPFYCYSTDPIRPQNAWFGYHSLYETVRGQSINANVSTCIPSKLYMLARHGTGYPTEAELNDIWGMEEFNREIASNYDQGKSSLCSSDIGLLRNWQFDPNITRENAYFVSQPGWDELEALAKRYQAAFPSILSPIYSRDDYFFLSSNYQRTQVSLQALADGLFGVNSHEQVYFEEPTDPDYLMRSHNLCPLYDTVSAPFVEQNAFEDGPEYQQMTSEVSAKLGFHGSHALRNVDIATLSIICKYEQAWDLNTTSPLCAAFFTANRQVLEYHEDLELYHRVGYGNPDYLRLYQNLMCFKVQDILGFLQSNNKKKLSIKQHTKQKHVVTLPLLMLTFGAFANGVPLTRHNFAQQTQRVWRSSEILGFSSNLAIVRYDCADGDNDILFLYNEKPLQIPGCKPNGLCKMSLLLEILSRFVDVDCIEVFCTNS